VAAAVADIGERVVLRDDGDFAALARCSARQSRLEGGGQPRDPAIDLRAEFFQHLGELCRRLMLLQADLRVVGHPVARLDQERRDPFDFADDPLLQCLHFFRAHRHAVPPLFGGCLSPSPRL